MIAELQQAAANYAHTVDELNVSELETVLTEGATWTFTMVRPGMLGPVAGGAAESGPDLGRCRAGAPPAPDPAACPLTPDQRSRQPGAPKPS